MENTSDSLMPRPLLLCLKSEKIVCYSVPDNIMSNKSEKEMALERFVVLLEKILEKYAEQVDVSNLPEPKDN